jgi:hypothetical protein
MPLLLQSDQNLKVRTIHFIFFLTVFLQRGSIYKGEL